MDGKNIDLLKAALRKRQPLLSLTNALRLVNGLGDGLSGLVLEQYNRHLVVQIFEKRWLIEKEALTDFVKESCNGQYLIFKDRTESISAYPEAIKFTVGIEYDTSKTIVRENGLNFGVDLNNTLNSGLFLDMRHNRKAVARMSKGRKVLNCFAYTCSFGVYCRSAGALNVVNVDISRKSLSRGQANYELNQIVPAANEFIRLNAVEYLKLAQKKDNRFDLIILDPPSFARNAGKVFRVKKDLAGLMDAAIKVLNPRGILFAATNFSGISYDNLGDLVKLAAGARRINKIQYLGQDKDFPGSGLVPESYLACALAEIR